MRQMVRAGPAPAFGVASGSLRCVQLRGRQNRRGGRSTTPSMVWSAASTSTRRPRARAVSDVAGPIDTTTGCGSGTVPSTSQRLSTVDDDVNVIASTSPARTRASAVGVGLGAHRAVHGEHVDGVAARGQPVGQHVAALLGAREQHALAARRRIGERVEQRLGDRALGHEIETDPARQQRPLGARADRARSARPRARGCRAPRHRGRGRRTRRRRSPT